jgi:hypothetical protein
MAISFSKYLPALGVAGKFLNLVYVFYSLRNFSLPHRKHPPRSPTQRVPPERDGNYDKPEFVQPQEETLMSIVWN